MRTLLVWLTILCPSLASADVSVIEVRDPISFPHAIDLGLEFELLGDDVSSATFSVMVEKFSPCRIETVFLNVTDNQGDRIVSVEVAETNNKYFFTLNRDFIVSSSIGFECRRKRNTINIEVYAMLIVDIFNGFKD